MNYLLIRNRNAAGGNRRLIWLLVTLTALIAVFSFFYPRFLSEALLYVAAPFWSAEERALETGGTLLSHLKTKTALRAEAEALREEILRQSAALADRTALADENQKLKAMLGRSEADMRLLAAVLATPPHSPYDTLVLDVGQEHGVEAGDIVLIENVALGKIAKVFDRVSVAELFSTAGTKKDMLLSHDGVHVPIQAEGEGGGAFKTILPKEVPVSKGDTVLMPGIFPTVFAKVEAIESDSSDSFQTIYFKNPVALGGIRFVEIRIKAPPAE